MKLNLGGVGQGATSGSSLTTLGQGNLKPCCATSCQVAPVGRNLTYGNSYETGA